MKDLDKIFGLVLIADHELQNKILSSIDEHWLLTDFHKDIFTSMNKCAGQNESIDLISVISRMKELPTFKQSNIYELSSISNDCSYVELMHWQMLLAECHKAYVVRKMSKLALRLNEQTQTQSTLSSYSDLLESSLREIAFKHTQTETNIHIVAKVMKRHDMAKEGIIEGVELPYMEFKRVILLESVDLMVVGARPAMGKTAFVISTAVKMAMNNSKVLVFALEMSKEQMMRRVLSNMAVVDSNRIKYGECNTYEKSKIELAKHEERLNNIILEEGTQTINSIARLISIHKPDIVFVDYLQKVKGSGKDDLYTSVTKVSNGLKEICQNMHIPIIAMAQLSRPEATKPGRRPSLPDLRQSGEIEQDASIVAFLHRPEYYGEETLEDGSDATGVCEVIIGKNREGEIGVYPMRVDLKTSTFLKRENINTFDSNEIESNDEFAPF